MKNVLIFFSSQWAPLSNFWLNYEFANIFDVNIFFELIFNFDLSTAITMQRFEIFILNQLFFQPGSFSQDALLEIKSVIRSELGQIFLEMEAARLDVDVSTLSIEIVTSHVSDVSLFSSFGQGFLAGFSTSDAQLEAAIQKEKV